jgi:hypothetical protein
MGGIYKSTSHIYFYFMIKKRVKKHHLTYTEENHLLGTPYFNLTEGATIDYAIAQDHTIVLPLSIEVNVVNNWRVNLGGEERLHLDSNGDMRITGVMKALGSVRWNQEFQILQFWDGNSWVDLAT